MKNIVHKKEILRVVVGSHAHGLARLESDIDYRSVYIIPTSDLLKVDSGTIKGASFTDGVEDDTSYELGHFLRLATKSNPSILEVFVSPVVEILSEGKELRELFPYVWSSQGVLNAFVGYSLSQRKKMMDEGKLAELVFDYDRKLKYGVAYLRVLILAQELLSTGRMTIKVPDEYKPTLLNIRDNLFSAGEILDKANILKEQVEKAYESNKYKFTDFEKVNQFLLRVRKDNWEF